MKIKVNVYKIFLIILWGVFHLLGCLFSPFGTYNPRIGLCCVLFFLSMLSIFILCVYEYRLEGQPKSFFKHALSLTYWLAYLPNLFSFVLTWIALKR